MKIKQDAENVCEALYVDGSIFTFGNGGSATIANHMEVDWRKNSGWVLRVQSLCSNAAMLLMIANDYGFEFTCSAQLTDAPEDSILVLISSSGKSANIVTAAKKAKAYGIPVIGFTGFDGGELKKLSDISVHIDSDDYGVVEDYHSNVMHEVARQIRQL